MILRLTVEYDGTAFCGFQWQPAVRSVAAVLERALGRLLGAEVKVTGAGRTDAGVHASGQVVSLPWRSRLPFERLLAALNALLPADCSVRETAMMPPGFSARFSARERTYVYTVLDRPARSALLARYAWHLARPLDFDAMQAAARHLTGEHDFRSLATVPAEASAIRTIRRLTIERRGGLVRVEIAANGFLHHMVRSIVGTLAECGLGRRDPAGVPEVLAAHDRAAGGVAAPAHGLCLAGVRYADGYDSFAEAPAFGGAIPALDAERAFP